MEIVKDGPIINFDEHNEVAQSFEEQMLEMQENLSKKKYKVKTNVDVLDYLMNEFYQNVQWNGYECYAVSETHKELNKIFEKWKDREFKTEKRSFSIKVEILEALFHFIKGHSSKGLENANKHRLLAEDFSIPMSELNQDRQKLRDLAMEAEAAKHGITVEDYKRAADSIHQTNI